MDKFPASFLVVEAAIVLEDPVAEVEVLPTLVFVVDPGAEVVDIAE